MSMSSGRRLNGSASPSAWRSMSMSKKRAPASVSLIFAEPEQGAPLESAAAKLPPAAYNKDITMRKRDRLDSASTVRDDHKDSVSVSGGSIKRLRQADASVDSLQSTHEPQYASVSASDVLQSEGLTTEPLVQPNPVSYPNHHLPTDPPGIPFPSAGSARPTPMPKPSPSGSFWSLSRPKGRDIPPDTSMHGEGKKEDGLVEDQALPADANALQPIAQPAPTHTTPEPEPQCSSPQQQIPAQRQPLRGWFSSLASTSTLTASRPPLSPTSTKSPNSHSHSNSIASIPSSIDEEVPRLSVVTPPNTPGPASVTQNSSGSTAKLSSLNPSTSRFTLSIPLLGRPKIPLEQVVAVVVAEDRQMSEPDQAVRGSEVRSEQATDTGQMSQTTSNPDISLRIAPASAIESPPNTAEGQMYDASWWGYLGWGQSGNNLPAPEAPTPNIPASPASPSSDTPTIRAVKSDPQLSVSVEVPEPHANTRPKGQELKDGLSVPTSVQGVLDAKNKAQSVFSAGTSQTQGSTTWYVPWKWYESSAAIAAEGPKESQADVGAAMTQSEMVKAEALARDRPPPDSTPTIEVTSPLPPAQEPTNPIESTIASNKSGWASFFSKSLVIRNITDGKEKDEHGMEVMVIDDDTSTPDPKPVATVSAGAVATNESNAKDHAKQSIDAQPQTNPKPSPSVKTKPEIAEGDKLKAPLLPLTNSESVKRDAAKAIQRKPSAAPSSKSGNKSPGSPRNPNLVLPTWADTFHTAPRSIVPSAPSSTILKTFNFVSGVFFQRDKDGGKKGKGKAKDKEFVNFAKELPRSFDVLRQKLEPDVLRGCSRAVIIGVHGWFPGAVMRTVLGDPTGTSGKFVDMMLQALDAFQEKHHVKLKKITKIPLEGEGTINKRVEKLYNSLLANKTWMDEIHSADVIFVATHSQGSVVSTHLLDRLIRDGHIRTLRSMEAAGPAESVASGSVDISPTILPQRLCCLALCGIHLGPLRYLSTSSLLQPYFQYFESAAARELFEFQDTESEVSKQYTLALRNVVYHGTKMVYVASLNDQVVPLYSGLFITASHPLILRALYIDGDAYQSSDFLSNLLVLLLRVLNSGISDSGLLAHLSEATAGSLNGVGHSTAYEELATYSLAVDYCFLTNDGFEAHPELVVDSFDAKNEQNDYEIPWALRDLIADERVAHFFSSDIVDLRDAFREWHPKTTILRDIKRKLQPIQRLPSSILKDSSGSVSKL